MNDVSYVAAINGLVKSGMAVNEAAEAIKCIRSNQADYWAKAVRAIRAAEQAPKVWILVGRYTDIPGRVDGHVYTGPNPELLLGIEHDSGDDAAMGFELRNSLFEVGRDVYSAIRRIETAA